MGINKRFNGSYQPQPSPATSQAQQTSHSQSLLCSFHLGIVIVTCWYEKGGDFEYRGGCEWSFREAIIFPCDSRTAEMRREGDQVYPHINYHAIRHLNVHSKWVINDYIRVRGRAISLMTEFEWMRLLATDEHSRSNI